MTIDEIVYQRERLRRDLAAAIAQLDDAADSYDPSAYIPLEDFVCAIGLAETQTLISDYAKAITGRIEQRKGTSR